MTKALVCVLAQTRGHKLTWPKYKQNFLDVLCEHVDLALCVGEGEDTANPFYTHAKHVWTYPEVQDWGQAFDHVAREMGREPDWRTLLHVKDQWLGGVKDEREEHPGSAGILLFFRWFLLKNLKDHNLLGAYDWFVITRSDYYYDIPHPPLSILSKEHVWVPNGEHYGGITDRHLVVPREFVEPALDVMSAIIKDPHGLRAEMQPVMSCWNLERYLALHFNKRGLLSRLGTFPYIMFTVRDPGDRSRWAWGRYNTEAGMIVKYESEFSTYKAFKELAGNSSLMLTDSICAGTPRAR